MRSASHAGGPGLLLVLALAVALASCGGEKSTGPPPSEESPEAIRIVTGTTGEDLDPDGYVVELWHGYEFRLGANDTVLVDEWIGAGSLALEILGIAANCGMTGPYPVAVTIPPGDTAEARFDIECTEFVARRTLTDEIVFTSRRSGELEVYVMDADGSRPMRITTNDMGEGAPSVSPDGVRIAFTASRTASGNWAIGGVSGILTVRADGSDSLNLTGWASFFDTSYGNTGWSPDGTRIAFEQYSDTAWPAVLMMNPDGSDVVSLTSPRTGGSDGCPDWSPDGSRLLYCSDLGEAGIELYSMNVDGSDIVRLTDDSTVNVHGTYSPDGSRIAFQSLRDPENVDWYFVGGAEGQFDLFVMNADGSDRIRLTTYEGQDMSPSWSPDGSRIVFCSDRDGDGEIYTIRPDGSDLVRLTDNATDDCSPSWAGS